MQKIIERVQVNAPFQMLKETYLPLFIEHRLNPEIGLDAIALDRYSVSDFSKVAEALHRHSLSITLHGPFMDLSAGSRDPEIRAVTRRRINQAIELLPVFNPKSLVCHAAYDCRHYGFMQAEWLKNSLDFWWWTADAVLKQGSRLMLENVFERRPQEISALLEKLKDRKVGLCLDTGHMSAFSQTSLEDWIALAGDYIGQCHLHDNHGDQDAHLALGRGNINFDALFRFLSKVSTRQPILTLEPHKEEDLWKSLSYLAKKWN